MGAIKRVLLWSAIAVLGGRLVILYLIPAWNSIVTDFPNYYTAAWAVRHGDPLSDLYDPVWFEREKHHAGIERPAALFNYFPPINALVLWPLANLSPIGAKRAWTVLNMVALGAVILLTVKAAGIGFLPAMAIALLGGDALGNNLVYGQFYIVLTLLLLAGVLAAERFPAIAGAAVATGTVAKLFPMALLVYLAIRRKYRVLIWAATAMIALTLVGVVVLGWAPHRVYLQEVLRPTLRGEIQDPYNVHWNTLQALLRRAFVREEILNPAPILDAPWLFFFLRPLVSIAIVTVTLFAISRARRHHLLVEYGAIIAMVSLITPSQLSSGPVLSGGGRWNGFGQAVHNCVCFCWDICADLLERHGCNGCLRPRVGHGTRFSTCLPGTRSVGDISGRSQSFKARIWTSLCGRRSRRTSGYTDHRVSGK